MHVEEFLPLREQEVVTLYDGAIGHVWAEAIDVGPATVVSTYADGPNPGGPAITRNAVGQGVAWYVSTQLRGDGLDRLLASVLDEAQVAREGREDLEVVRRSAAGGDCPS
jgi:beta-galactosidase